MKKVLFSLDHNTLLITYKNHRKIREDLINTNIISDNELIFGEDYLKTNEKIVSLFLKELCEMKHCNQVLFENNELTYNLLPYFNNNPSINKIYIKSDETITYGICEKVISSKYIKEINCYNIPSFMVEMLDQNYIKVETRSEFFYTSEFMQENNLVQYSKIYYKMNVHLKLPLTEDDKSDFTTFCVINHYLKSIKVIGYLKEDLLFLIQTIKENHLKNVTIYIDGKIATNSMVETLKELNKENKKKKIKCTLSYSDDYLKDNIFKQVIINTIKICVVILFILVGSVVAYVGTRNYIALKKEDAIKENINNVIKEQEKNETPPIDTGKVVKNQYIAALFTINPDVKGWLKVNNTNIDYPVVKASDNKFYLTNNLYKQKDINGWIYMDYRNDDKELNQNTIIYGHNMYYSGIMFGTLHKAANKSWYQNPENQIISFNTMYETMNWQIFSIYQVGKTNDYLKVKFATDNDFQEYIDYIKKRSINNFNIEVTAEDKILTLSTCTGDNERFVVHAKLI